MTKNTNLFLFLAIATILIASPLAVDSAFADDDKKAQKAIKKAQKAQEKADKAQDKADADPENEKKQQKADKKQAKACEKISEIIDELNEEGITVPEVQELFDENCVLEVPPEILYGF